MKKIVKMSLVAAVAVAGLTTANAKPLEEAIKNVDVSGSVVYRYDDRSSDDNVADSSSNSYKAAINVKSKVNDDVTANFRILTADGRITDDNNFATLNNTTGSDANPSLNMSNVYFGYTGIANTTVNVGKQGLTTPWTVAIDSDGNEQTGTGILALSTMGPVTVAAAYFNQTNLASSGDVTINGSIAANGVPVTAALDGASNVATVAVMGNIGPVALDAWYLDMQDSFDTYTVGATANLDFDAVKLAIGARHTVLSFDDAMGALEDEDNSLTKITLGAKMGIFGAKLNYGWTDEEGGLAALDNDAATGMQGWTVQLNGVADATYLQAGIDAQVLDTLNIGLNYHVLDKDEIKNGAVVVRGEAKDTELYLQATYNMSKNLSTYVRFGEQEREDAGLGGKDLETTIGRLQVQYSF